MAGSVNIEELKTQVFFESASLDDRYVWEEIAPDSGVAPVDGDRWADNLKRFRLVRCAHQTQDRVDGVCSVCGEKITTAKAAPAKKRVPDKRR